MQAVTRILYKQIGGGDLLKLVALSNSAQTGGGARDFRFGSYPNLQGVVESMFPKPKTQSRIRNGVRQDVESRLGNFHWSDESGTIHTEVAVFEPPTTARPREGRLTNVDQLGSLDLAFFRTAESRGGRVILLFVQQEDQSVWPYYVSENSLINDSWDAKVAREILRCLKSPRPESNFAIGYFDFEKSEGYCNAK
jgi:hypothetical protein